MAVQPIPAGYEGVTPYLIFKDAKAAIEFYKQAFGAVEHVILPGPDGGIAHAELKVGSAIFMLANENPMSPIKSPLDVGGITASFLIYVPDVDAHFDRAVKAGAKVQRPVENQFYGDRSGMLVDPFGYVWMFATHIEDPTPEQMKQRMAELFKK